MKLIGVTGSTGKTTTSWLLRSVLRAAGKKVGLLGSIEYDLCDVVADSPNTTPWPGYMVKLLGRMESVGAEYCVFEMASGSLWDSRFEDHGVELDGLVVTCVKCGYHLYLHGTFENYVEAKLHAPDLLKRDGIFCLNSDDPLAKEFAAKSPCPVTFYGEGENAKFWHRLIRADLRGGRFLLSFPDGEREVATSLLGIHQGYNLAAAASMASKLGIDTATILRGLAAVEIVPARLHPVGWAGDALVMIDEGYTLASTDATLRTIRKLMLRDGRIVVVFGNPGGRQTYERNRGFGHIISRLADAAIFTTSEPRGEDPEIIAHETEEGMRGRNFPTRFIRSRDLAIRTAVTEAREGDVVLIVGRYPGLVIDEGGERTVFCDEASAMSAIRRRNGWGCEEVA